LINRTLFRVPVGN